MKCWAIPQKGFFQHFALGVSSACKIDATHAIFRREGSRRVTGETGEIEVCLRDRAGDVSWVARAAKRVTTDTRSVERRMTGATRIRASGRISRLQGERAAVRVRSIGGLTDRVEPALKSRVLTVSDTGSVHVRTLRGDANDVRAAARALDETATEIR